MNSYKILSILYEKTEKFYSLNELVKIGSQTPLPIKIEFLKNTIKKWGSENIIPFDYGEILGFKNEADNMYWDCILPTSTTIKDKNLLISGIIKINPEANKLPLKIGNKPGNHKIIISKDGVLTNEDKNSLNNYFKDLKAFEEPVYFNDITKLEKIEEEWSKFLLGKYKLGNVNTSDYKGIAVGGVARRYFKAPKVKNNFLKTN